MKLFGGFVHGIDDYAVIALAGHSGINIQRGLLPIELEQDRFAICNLHVPVRSAA